MVRGSKRQIKLCGEITTSSAFGGLLVMTCFAGLLSLQACMPKPLSIPSAAAKAKDLREKEEYEEAIDVYKKHINASKDPIALVS